MILALKIIASIVLVVLVAARWFYRAIKKRDENWDD